MCCVDNAILFTLCGKFGRAHLPKSPVACMLQGDFRWACGTFVWWTRDSTTRRPCHRELVFKMLLNAIGGCTRKKLSAIMQICVLIDKYTLHEVAEMFSDIWSWRWIILRCPLENLLVWIYLLWTLNWFWHAQRMHCKRTAMISMWKCFRLP